MKVAILITCHNRKHKTLQCLNSFYNQELNINTSFDIYLVDDGSTDGTSNDVLNMFPLVKIINGDGTLYWNRGMHKAWCEALTSGNEYDGVLWLNDDTILVQGAISSLCKYLKPNLLDIVVGTTCSSGDSSVVTYGAFLKGELLQPKDIPQECDSFNGNFVYIPRGVYEKIGILDFYYRHSWGDFDYAMKAYKAGFMCIVLPTVGICDRNPPIKKWMRGNIIQRYKALYSPLGNNPLESFHFYKQISYPRAIVVFIYMHIRVLFTLIKNKHYD